MGMKDRGRLMPDYLADVVLVEEGEFPRVRATFRNGRVIYSDTQGMAMWEKQFLVVS